MIRILIGPPCAGAADYVAEHATPGDITIEWDALAAALNAVGDAESNENLREVTAYARFMLAAHSEAYAASEHTVWLAATRPEYLGDITPLISAGGRVIVIDPGIDACLARAEADGRGPEIIEAIKAWYEAPPEIPATWQEQRETEKRGDAAMRAKNFNIQVKATEGEQTTNPFGGDLQEGDFIAYASTFHEDPDSYGDIVKAGAFEATLDEWREKGAFNNTADGVKLPLLFGHRMDDPAFNIGHIVDAKEDDNGLLVWGRIDLDTEKGALAYRLIKSRRLAQLSFAYDIVDAEEIKNGGYLLKELAVHEVSLVQLGANRHTSVLAVKAAVDAVQTVKGDFTEDEADTLAEVEASLREAADQIAALLATEPTEETPDEEQDTEPVDSEDFETGEAATGSTADTTKASASTATIAAARLRLAAAKLAATIN